MDDSPSWGRAVWSVIWAVQTGSIVLFFVGLVYFFFVPSIASVIQPAGGLLMAGLTAYQLRRRRPRPLLLMSVIAALVMTYVAVGTASSTIAVLGWVTPTIILGATGLVSLLVSRRRRKWIAAGYMVLIAILNVFEYMDLGTEPGDLLSGAATSVIFFGFIAYIVASMRTDLEQSLVRNRQLVRAAPAAVWEADYSSALALMERWRQTLSPTVFRDPSHHTRVMRRRLFADVTAVSINEQTMQFLGVDDPEEAMERLVLMSEGELYQHVFDDVLLPLSEGRPYGQYQFSAPRPGREPMDIMVRWHAVTDEAGSPLAEHVIYVAFDITHQKQAEQALARQISERNEFVASVSHELRTPLSVIVGLAEELSSTTNRFDPGEAQELIELLSREAIDMSDIVSDLLTSTRAQAGSIDLFPEPIVVARAVEECALDFGLDVGEVLVDKGLVVSADRVRIRQIMRNLITNAQRYGGERVRIRAHRSDDMVRIEVRDNGVAIDPVRVREIFEPFARAHDPKAVTASVGLGLTVARTLAQLHGGELAYHHDGQESVFTLLLPAVGRTATTSIGEATEGESIRL